MELKPGYKQTEIGVIPSDWDVYLMGSLGTFSKGKGISKDEALSGEIPCIRYGEIYTHHSDFIRSFNSRISEEVAKSSKRLNKGDLLFAGSGETKEEIGKCVAFVGDEEAYAGGDIVILNPNKGDSKFFGYLFNTPIVVRQKASKGQGDAIVHISSSALSSVAIPFPLLPEQNSIAETLSDVDALIGALDRLIGKKRDLKQAAMQQLLTGQIRLPGFSGEWKVKPLKHFVTRDRFAIVDGPFGSQLKVDEYVETGVPLIEMEHLFDDFITKSIERHITPRKFEELKRSAVYPGDIIISKTGSLGKLGLIPDFVEQGLITSRLAKITIDPTHADRHFVFQSLLKLRGEGYWEKVSQGGTMQILGIGMLQNAPIPDITVREQSTIAVVLSDMDAEIAALEARRDKTRLLKQGMMQELLTGKTRLI